MSSSRLRRHAPSPAAGPLDDDDLLCEILLRLPPDPSSLPRASAVCKRWRRLVSDPGFSRRFRLRHRRNPPLLGFFDRYGGYSFRPTLEAPNRIPPGRFSLQRDKDHDRSMSLGCRHGLFLIYLSIPRKVLVWDPITGDKYHIAVPVAFDMEKTLVNGAVLRPAGEDQHFQVVLAGAVGDDIRHVRALACVYSSKTGLWGNLISTPLPYEPDGGQGPDGIRIPTMVSTDEAVMAGDSLYWKLVGNFFGILEFDLVKQSLAVIRVPVDEGKCLKMMRAESGGLGCLVMSGYNAQLWKRKTDCDDGVASWGLARTIELDKLLSLKSEEKWSLNVLGIAEENNVVFVWTLIGLFMIHLESLKFKNLFKTNIISYYQPFESVYTAEICAGGGHDGPEILLNT